MESRPRFSKADAIIALLAIASVIMVMLISRSHNNRGMKREAYVHRPYRFPRGAAENCAELWFHPLPYHPGEEVMALCDALLLKIFRLYQGER
ncbi:hypothetical protein F511_21614 [Dorcoceras hygrometricum]|uniref:Uncharacterized protein n=1 Tax=Dorcoceras hygrometricum TaxID=472368 RepID=A0A2Z7BVC0_9LAMI|nr:hypothetical protein F511_21614 [Dorcoceras hygrometricum]